MSKWATWILALIGAALFVSVLFIAFPSISGVVVKRGPGGGVSTDLVCTDCVDTTDLKDVDSPGDEECATYEATGTGIEWQACGGGGETLAQTLALGADANDVDTTSWGKLEFFDAGLYLDADADGVMNITSDGTLELHSADWDIGATGIATGMGNITSDGTVEAATLTEGGVAVYDATSADTAHEAELNNSAGLLAALSDETGTGTAVFSISPTLTGTADFDAVTATSFTADPAAAPSFDFTDSDTTDEDVSASIDVNCTDTATTTEDCDVTFTQQVAGTDTDFIVADADGSVTATSHEWIIRIQTGAAPAATCTVGEIFIDTDEGTDTNCATTADNSLCLCVAADTWVALGNN